MSGITMHMSAAMNVSGIVGRNHQFMIAKKVIKNPEDMVIWEKSEAYCEYFGFILALNEAVQKQTLNAECSQSPAILKTISMLTKFDQWITEIPPVEQPQRFGNKSFKEWLQRLQKCGDQELKQVLPEDLHQAVPELVQYLCEGFGNSTRIDYGTGHEMAFIMFLCCMFKIGAYKLDDQIAVVTKVFNQYLKLVRRLQLVYRMEPAGSHGVWSLDDYQFVPFVWGSAQLIGHPYIEPPKFLDPGIIDKFRGQFMFLDCIEFISKVKVGPFAEHSNQLWNISAVTSWSKVNAGLIKMYKAEVLSKFPVIQHVLFGSLLSTKQVSSSSIKKEVRRFPACSTELPQQQR